MNQAAASLYESDDVARQLERMDAQAIDGLPFGVIRLTREGLVQLYSTTEAQQSGFNRRPALGLDFFEQVAPCMNTPMMKGLIEQAWRAGTLDMDIGWVGDIADPNRAYAIRATSSSDGGVWLLINRDL